MGVFLLYIALKPLINYDPPQPTCEPARGGLNLSKLTGQVAGRLRDSGDAEGGAVPQEGVIELGDGDVEAMAQLLLERAHDLTAVLERLRVLDGEFEGKRSEGHVCEGK